MLIRKKWLIGLALVLTMAGTAYAQVRIEWMGHMFFRPVNPQVRYNGTLAFQDMSGNPAAISASNILTSATTTYTAFFPAVENCVADNTSTVMIKVRLAANDWALARTAAGAETQNIHCHIPLRWRTTSGKGSRLDSFRISHQITVANLTSATFNALATTTYVNNTANLVAAYGGTTTITMPTATQTLPYLTAASLSAPAFMNTANAAVSIDYTVVMANTGVYRLYGIGATYSMAD